MGKAKSFIYASRLLANKEKLLPYALGLYVFALEENGTNKKLQKAKFCCGNCIRFLGKYLGPVIEINRKKINEGIKSLPSKKINLEANIELKENQSDKTRIVSLKDDKIVVTIGPAMSDKFSSACDVGILEDICWRCFYLDSDNGQRYWKSELHPKKGELLKYIFELEKCMT